MMYNKKMMIQSNNTITEIYNIIIV